MARTNLELVVLLLPAHQEGSSHSQRCSEMQASQADCVMCRRTTDGCNAVALGTRSGRGFLCETCFDSAGGVANIDAGIRVSVGELLAVANRDLIRRRGRSGFGFRSLIPSRKSGLFRRTSPGTLTNQGQPAAETRNDDSVGRERVLARLEPMVHDSDPSHKLECGLAGPQSAICVLCRSSRDECTYTVLITAGARLHICEKCSEAVGGSGGIDAAVRLAVGEVLAVACRLRSPKQVVGAVLAEFGVTYVAFADSTEELAINERMTGVSGPLPGIMPHVVVHQTAHLILRRGLTATDADPTGSRNWPEFLRSSDSWNDHGPLWAGLYVSLLREQLGWSTDDVRRFRDAGVEVTPDVPPDIARRMALERGMSVDSVMSGVGEKPRVFRRPPG